MSHRGQESQPGYVDGICVKISERYKPPPRINLAISYSQRLSLNKQIQDNIVPYDFSLEVNVKDRVKELRNARKLVHEEKKTRLEKLKEARQKYEENKTLNVECKNVNVSDQETKIFEVVSSEATNSQAQLQQVLYPTYSNILTPIPLTNVNTSKSYACDPVDKSPFNISDFEADTSSPFDNMELKTINDIEELAQVLKKDNTSYLAAQYSNYVPVPNVSTHSTIHSNYVGQETLTVNPHYIPYNNLQSSATSVPSYGHSTATTMYSNLNGYYYAPEVSQANTTYTSYTYNNLQSENSSDNSPSQTQKFEENKQSFKSVPDIMKALQAELDNTHIQNKIIENHTQKQTVRPKRFENIISETELDETYELLPKNLQHLSKNISSMGFPLSRVARACQVLGDDHKKIVEYLLAMSELLDLGFTEKDVSNALLQCNNDRDKALDILIS